jgi:hypothetical protein
MTLLIRNDGFDCTDEMTEQDNLAAETDTDLTDEMAEQDNIAADDLDQSHFSREDPPDWCGCIKCEELREILSSDSEEQ